MMSPREAAARAVAGVRAAEAGDWLQVLEQAGREPELAFAGASALCAQLAAELRRRGGNPEAVFDKITCLQLETALG
jgi:hypothetical protein